MLKLENIPAELKALPQWVNWRSEVKKGKPTKIPVNPHTLKNAMTDVPATWGFFEIAVSNINNDGIQGIGFVCSNNDLYGGIDLDKCRNPQTGDVEPWALEIIQQINSYCEISPSGTGIRIFVKAKLPQGSRKIGRVEIYDSGRFFTITGQTMEGFNEIKTWEGNKLHTFLMNVAKDIQILDRAFASANGEKFKALWDGNWDGYPSQSEADMALVSLLFFHTKNREETDRLFRKSGLMRAKWDEKHYADGTTYGGKILDQVCKDVRAMGYERREDIWPEIIPFDDFSSLPDFPTEALMKLGKEMVEIVAEVNQVDIGLPASIYLAMLAACGAKKVEVDLRTHKEPVNLFVCSILDPGNRKTTTMGNMTVPLYEYQKTKAEDMQDEIREALNKYEINNARLTRLRKQAAHVENASERMKLQHEAAELLKEIDENPVPQAPVLIVDDITSEATGLIMADNNERLAVISAEGGIFGIMAGRYCEKGGNFDIYLKGHAGDPFSVHRIGRKAKHMLAPALTMCLTVQHDVIKEIGGNKHFRGRGLLARFLYCFCKSQVGYRKRQNSTIPDALLNSYNAHIQKLANIPLNLRTIALSQEAQAVWNEFYNDIETDMQPGKPLEVLKDWGSKLPGAVARIAGLLHFAEYGSEAGDKPISVNIVNASCVIGAYYREHAIATFGLMQEDPRIEAAKKILEYIKQHQPETFKGREVLRYKSALKSMEDVLPGLRILIERGYIRKIPEQYSGVGRPEAISYEVNPRMKTL